MTSHSLRGIHFSSNLNRGVLVCTDILSRGIDIDDVDWVVQYDLPTNASSFVHRCGRTARSDRNGNAIVFLLPNEDCYIDFIRLNQNVCIIEISNVLICITWRLSKKYGSLFFGRYHWNHMIYRPSRSDTKTM